MSLLSRSQTVTLELIQCVVFLIMFYIGVLHPLITKVTDFYNKLDTCRKEWMLLTLSDKMITYSGRPANWNRTNVRSIGLAEAPWYVNRSKLEELKYIPIEVIEGVPTKLIIRAETYSESLVIKNLSGCRRLIIIPRIVSISGELGIIEVGYCE